MRYRLFKAMLVFGLGLTLAGAVGAQEATAPDEPEGEEQVTVAPEEQQEEAGRPSSVFTEEVTVTAQRREESAQQVGVAMSVLGEETLSELNVSNVTDIGTFSPNVNIKDQLGNAQPIVTIRGVGLADFNANADAPSAIYFDDVYLVSPAMAKFQMFDTQRVEILKGPQGTLYGRNTTGGAINYIPKRPTQEFEGYATVGYGSFGTADGEFAISGGFSENVAGRLSVRGVTSDGGPWTNRVDGHEFGGEKILAARGQLQWYASDAVAVLFSVQYGRDKSQGIGYQHIGVVDPDTYDYCAEYLNGGPNTYRCIDFWGYRDPDGGDPSQGDYSVLDLGNDNTSLGGMFRVDWDTGPFVLTSITGYDIYERRQNDDGDASPLVGVDVLEMKNDITQFSQEIRLVSNAAGKLNWIAGAYYGTDKITGEPNQLIALDDYLLTRADTNYDQDTTTVAVYGHGDLFVSPSVKLWAGLRYTYDSKDYSVVSTDLNPFGMSCVIDPFCDPGFVGPVTLASGDHSISYNDLSGGLGLEWHLNDDWMVFGSAKKGFKAGGFNAGIGLFDEFYNPFDPETLWAYEAGFKATLADGSLIFNTSAFHYIYEDMQVFAQQDIGGIPQIVRTNASDSKISGLETELWWRPSVGLDLRLGAGYLDTEYVNFQSFGEDFSGNHLSNAPEFTYTAAAAYQASVTKKTQAGFSVVYNWNDTTYREISNHPWMTTDPYGLLDAQVFLQFGSVKLTVWGKNLTDERYITEAFDQASFGQLIALYNWPRTFGTTLGVQF